MGIYRFAIGNPQIQNHLRLGMQRAIDPFLGKTGSMTGLVG